MLRVPQVCIKSSNNFKRGQGTKLKTRMAFISPRIIKKRNLERDVQACVRPEFTKLSAKDAQAELIIQTKRPKKTRQEPKTYV